MTEGTTAIAVVDPSKYDLDTARAHEIDQAFEPLILQREAIVAEFKAIIEGEITEEKCKQAHALRLKLVKVRTGMAAIHKSQKHLFLMAGKFVDALKNANTEPVVQMEEKLMEIQNHFVNIERERVAKIAQERTHKLSELGVENIPQSLGIMPDDAWAAMLAGYKAQADARAEAARLEEERRIAEEQRRIEEEKAKEAERIRVAEENKRLAAELAAKQEEQRKLAEQAAKERAAAAAAAKKAKEEADAKLRAAEEKAAAERAAREEEDRKRREAAEQARRAQEAAEARAADEANRRAKEVAAADFLVGIAGVSQRLATIIVGEIAAGNMPHVSMNY